MKKSDTWAETYQSSLVIRPSPPSGLSSPDALSSAPVGDLPAGRHLQEACSADAPRRRASAPPAHASGEPATILHSSSPILLQAPALAGEATSGKFPPFPVHDLFFFLVDFFLPIWI